jgi:putative ABC transport system permease protein
MSLWQLAAKNVWQNRGRYIAYLASAIFAVMIYFLYIAIARHPELQSGYRGAGYAVQGMRAASVVIALFTFLFLLYSNSAFVRSRLKEFGLLSLMGVTRRQLIQIVLWEGAIIATVALVSGLGLGLLFLRLFLMAVSSLLQLSVVIPFYAGPPVWAETILLFGSFFVIVALLTIRSLLNRPIIQLIRAARQPKGAPRFSRAKTISGLVLLLGGYAWACIPNPVAVVLGVLPVTAIVSIGTFLLMREGSIALLSWLHRREKFFYRPGPFLSVSQLIFKMQENYRVLAAGAILMAVILSAVGTVASLYVVVSTDAIELTPHALQVSKAPGGESTAEAGLVDGVLQTRGLNGLTRTELTTVSARLKTDAGEYEVHLVPYSFYKGVHRPRGELKAIGSDQEAVLVAPQAAAPANRERFAPITGAELTLGEQRLPLQVERDLSGRLLNVDGIVGFTLVLSDDRFHALVSQTPLAERAVFTMWDAEAWKSPAMQGAVTALRTSFMADGPVRLTTTLESYQETVATLGISLFIGVFVSLVFFAAACSLLYFRLFTEIEDDRTYFRRLEQLGVGESALKRLARGQALVVFFVPFLIGLLHSTFAMKALGALTMRSVLTYGWLVAAAYLVVYALYFSVSAAFYWRSLRVGLNGAVRAG